MLGCIFLLRNKRIKSYLSMKYQVNQIEQCFFSKSRINQRSEDNGLITAYILPRSVRLVNAKS